jgi:deoxyhypusine synthase
VGDVRVRILRACRGKVDGISLDRFTVGRIYDVHVSLATYLLVERFAAPESDAEPALVVPLSDADARRLTTERAQKDRAESSDE